MSVYPATRQSKTAGKVSSLKRGFVMTTTLLRLSEEGSAWQLTNQ